MQQRIAGLDWQHLEAELDLRGYALTPRVLTQSECTELAAYYDRDAYFRKTVNMARHGYGEGEYRYFAEPVPEPIASLREGFYPPLARIANRWVERLRSDERFPETLGEYRAVCEARG